MAIWGDKVSLILWVMGLSKFRGDLGFWGDGFSFILIYGGVFKFWDEFRDDWGGGSCVISMGRQAMEMNRRSDIGGSEDRGPLSKEKRRSLKLASQVRYKAVGAPRWTEERRNGRTI